MATWSDRHIYHPHNKVSFLLSGEPYFTELEALIAGTKRYLHIQLYIFDLDETGSRIMELLLDAVRRGVKIFIALDAYGSPDFTSRKVNELRQRGLFIRTFSPVSLVGMRIGRRLHHKIVLADGEVAMIGGINFADKYRGTSNAASWLDFGVRAEGQVVQDIEQICEKFWGRQFVRKHIRHLKREQVKAARDANIRIRLLQNDWFMRTTEISRAYRQSIRHAEKEIFIAASYFLPGLRVLRLLRKASARGVNVTLLLSGISDVGIARRATKYLYDWLFRNKISISEWSESVMHGKLMVVDEKIVNVGSYNMNSLSDYGSLELNMEIDDKEFAHTVLQKFLSEVAPRSQQVLLETYNRISIPERVLNWCSYYITRFLLFLLFFIIRRDETQRSIPKAIRPRRRKALT